MAVRGRARRARKENPIRDVVCPKFIGQMTIIQCCAPPFIELSPYSTKKRVGVGSSLRHLTHEMYMPNAKTQRQAPNATYIPLEYRLRLLPNAKKSTHKKRNIHGQRKKLASPNARDTNMLVFLALRCVRLMPDLVVGGHIF